MLNIKKDVLFKTPLPNQHLQYNTTITNKSVPFTNLKVGAVSKVGRKHSRLGPEASRLF